MNLPNWNPTWDGLLNDSFFSFYNMERKRKLVNWQSVVQDWQRDDTASEEAWSRLYWRRGVVFEADIDLALGGHYPMVWDIEKAARLPRTETVMSLAFLKSHVRAGSQRVPVPGSPILLAHYPINDPSFVIIDGNHRVNEAYQKSPNGHIGVAMLSQTSMYQALCDELFQRCYDWHAAISKWLYWETREQGEPEIPVPKEFCS